MHGLATNAIKYGDLRRRPVWSKVSWSLDGDRVGLVWQESGGPQVRVPARQGFGTRMIQQTLAAELQADVAFDYRPHGLSCTIVAPCSAIQPG
jgi:two-component sensor histidine kinase